MRGENQPRQSVRIEFPGKCNVCIRLLREEEEEDGRSMLSATKKGDKANGHIW